MSEKPFPDVVLSEEFTREVRAALKPEPWVLAGIICVGGVVVEVEQGQPIGGAQCEPMNILGECWFKSILKKTDDEIATNALKHLGQPPSVPKLGEF